MAKNKDFDKDLEELGKLFDELPEESKKKLLGYVSKEAAKEQQNLIKTIMTKLRGVESEDINFIQGIIDQTFMEKGIDLSDPLVNEVSGQIFKKLKRKRRSQ